MGVMDQIADGLSSNWRAIQQSNRESERLGIAQQKLGMEQEKLGMEKQSHDLANQSAQISLQVKSMEAQEFADSQALRRKQVANKYANSMLEQDVLEKEKDQGGMMTSREQTSDKYSHEAEIAATAHKYKMAEIQARTKTTKEGATTKQSIGAKKLDQVYAKDYNEWTTSGKGQVEKSMSNLEDAKSMLNKVKDDWLDTTSGNIIGALPNMLRTRESRIIQQKVQESALAGIRAAMGAQFTEKEGTRVLGMAYDPQLDPIDNIAKIDKTIEELVSRAKAQESKRKWFDEHDGSLSGWTGEDLNIKKDTSGKTKIWDEKKEARLKELRAKRGY